MRERLIAMLAAFFAAVPLLLAGIGLYAVLNYSVLHRRREIGIRMAIGSTRAGIVRIVTLEVFLMIALGGCAGMVISRAIVRDRFAHEEVLHVFSMLMLVMGLAPILAPLFGGWVLLVANWRWIFGVQVAFAFVVGLTAICTLPESRSTETAQVSESTRC